jgi:catechol 2,3-dioxygenase-like lactoylglutathione lyase family enzyme
LLLTPSSSGNAGKKALTLGVLNSTTRNDNPAMTDTSTQKKSHDPAASLKGKPRPEHIAFNVTDPAAVAKWYCDHLGMKVVRKSPPPSNTHFIGDSAGNMLFELYNNPSAPIPDYGSFSHMAMHLAFMVNDVKSIRDSLLAVGAKLVEDTVITTGDQVLILRDPWGLAIQFVRRISPMLKPTGIRPEHVALNVPDPPRMAKWYVKNLGLKVVRKGTPPRHATFVADAGNNMMMELYHNSSYPLLDLPSIHHLSFHFAFTVDDVLAIRSALIAAGAKLAEDVRVSSGGDQILMLRDPWGVPLQFIKRAEPMLK